MRADTNQYAGELDGLGRRLGVHVEEILRRTDKTLLAAGQWRRQPVVVKLLLADDAFWTGKWRHEIDVYRLLHQHRPPVRVPELLHTDGDRLLILSRLPGDPLSHDRYPRHPISRDPAGQDPITAALDALTTLADWTPPQAAFRRIFDYPDRVTRYHTYGLLDDRDRDALTVLLGRCGGWQLNHGDPLPSNLLYHDGQCGLIDWEFTGLYLPGFDLALLHTVLARTPRAAARIEQMVTERGIEIPYTINLAMVLTRELRLHRELPDTHPDRDRLPLLDVLWTDTRCRLHALAAGGR